MAGFGDPGLGLKGAMATGVDGRPHWPTEETSAPVAAPVCGLTSVTSFPTGDLPAPTAEAWKIERSTPPVGAEDAVTDTFRIFMLTARSKRVFPSHLRTSRWTRT